MKKWILLAVIILILGTALHLLTKREISLSGMKNIIHQLPRGKGKYRRRELEQIEQVVIHHSATEGGDPWAFARHHVQTRGWPGIGYHFVIQPNGVVYQTNSLQTVSYHTSGQNTRSVGICLTGNFDKQEPSGAQIIQLVELIRKLNEKLGRKLDISGHNEYAAKSCPGLALDVDEIRRMIDNQNTA